MSLAVSSLEGGGGEDPQPPSSGLVPTPVPPVPSSFSALSPSFTFPGSSTNAVPPARPAFATSSNFSFPGAPPSSLAPTSAGSTQRFAYPSPVPSGISPLPPFAAAPGGFSYQVLPNGVPQAMPVSAVPQDSQNTQPASAPSSDIGRSEAQVLNLQNSAPGGSPLQPSLDPAQPQGKASTDNALIPASSVQNLPNPPLIGGVPLRPGLISQMSPTMPVVPPRPVYPANLLPGVPMMPTGVLGSAPAGMGPRFPIAPFGAMVRPPGFPMRVPTPPGRPVIRPGIIVRPPLVVEKPQTLCYVGKIAPTLDDTFLKSVLEMCGPVKSWKRAQEPAVGSFGFCEFETPEGVMRALRLLNGFNLDGREIKLTVTQAARDSLERYIQRKGKEQQQMEALKALEMEVETAPGVEAPEPPIRLDIPESSKSDVPVEEGVTEEKRFGIINKEDKEADEEALKKLTSLLEERAKVMPPPSATPPLSSTPDAPSGTPTKDGKRDGQEEEETSEMKRSSELDKAETNTPERAREEDMEHGRDRDRSGDRERSRDREWSRDRDSRNRDSRDRGRDRERERERERRKEKERQIDQAERERERNHARRERERHLQTREADRRFEDSYKYWASKEKEKERRRNLDKERERELEKQRRKLIKLQEEDSDDEGWSKSRRRGEERKRIQREREDDERDCIEEEEEVEAKRRKLKEEYEEELKKRLGEAVKAEAAASRPVGSEGDTKEAKKERDMTASSHNNEQLATGDGNYALTNGTCDMAIDESEDVPMSMYAGEKQTSSPIPRKLGFGLVGSGKRAAVPSVFHQEDEEEEPKDRGLRPLVPIDYSTEEMQVVSSFKANATPGNAHLAAAAEFAKTLSKLGDRVDHKEYSSKNRELGGRNENDRGRERDRDKQRNTDGSREKDKKLDTKQLIDSIPKTRDELFAYKINWQIFDQHKLHERLRPWIQKKIVEFLGEEETTFVDFIVSNTRKHESAATILGLLTTILDDEAEMFVMKMWRMLIFEIKKVELGLAPANSKPKD